MTETRLPNDRTKTTRERNSQMTTELNVLSTAQMIGVKDIGREEAIILETSKLMDQQPDHLTSATFVATAHGVYEASINGVPVSESVLNPGWTSYPWRLQVQEFDVTSMVIGGGTAQVDINVVLGNGWYRGKLGFEGAEIDYGSHVGFMAALSLEFDDGSKQTVVTDTSWAGRQSDIVANSLYNGETVDARLRGHAAIYPVGEIAFDRSTLVPQAGPLITRTQIVHPISKWTSPSGATLVDFGQNLVGRVRLNATGSSGDRITVRHAEVLEHGELGIRPLRGAAATDTFILSGDRDAFEPRFTFHGFRYIEISTSADGLNLEDLEAVVIHSDIRRTGWFESSNTLVNQLVENSFWSQRGNFLDIPTDCPQRDERLGWTGDIAVYAPTAAFQFDVSDFLNKWLIDVSEEVAQSSAGVVPIIAPDLMKQGLYVKEFADTSVSPTAIWGDAGVWVPQALWNAYGDFDRLASHYPLMAAHVKSVENVLSPDGLWEHGFQFGDWLDPDAPPESPADAKADTTVVATACLYRSAKFVAEAAELLNKPEDAKHWTFLAENTRNAFNEAFVDNGVIKSDCTTVYALAINFGLLDEKDREIGASRLAQLVQQSRYRVSTGFAGTPYITWALSETGHIDDAYKLLLETECPSWLYPVTMGATTVWERWDSMLPDGSINPGEMTSFNHYALGAVADWIYQVVGGIRPAAPGYSKVLIKPLPGPGIDWANVDYDSEVGRISSHWKVRDNEFSLQVTVPDEIPAEVVLPDGSVQHIVGGTHRYGGHMK